MADLDWDREPQMDSERHAEDSDPYYRELTDDELNQLTKEHVQ